MWGSFWTAFVLGHIFHDQIRLIILGLILYSSIEIVEIIKISQQEQQLTAMVHEARAATEEYVAVVKLSEKLCKHEDEPDEHS